LVEKFSQAILTWFIQLLILNHFSKKSFQLFLYQGTSSNNLISSHELYKLFTVGFIMLELSTQEKI